MQTLFILLLIFNFFVLMVTIMYRRQFHLHLIVILQPCAPIIIIQLQQHHIKIMSKKINFLYLLLCFVVVCRQQSSYRLKSNLTLTTDIPILSIQSIDDQLMLAKTGNIYNLISSANYSKIVSSIQIEEGTPFSFSPALKGFTYINSQGNINFFTQNPCKNSTVICQSSSTSYEYYQVMALSNDKAYIPSRISRNNKLMWLNLANSTIQQIQKTYLNGAMHLTQLNNLYFVEKDKQMYKLDNNLNQLYSIQRYPLISLGSVNRRDLIVISTNNYNNSNDPINDLNIDYNNDNLLINQQVIITVRDMLFVEFFKNQITQGLLIDYNVQQAKFINNQLAIELDTSGNILQISADNAFYDSKNDVEGFSGYLLCQSPDGNRFVTLQSQPQWTVSIYRIEKSKQMILQYSTQMYSSQQYYLILSDSFLINQDYKAIWQYKGSKFIQIHMEPEQSIMDFSSIIIKQLQEQFIILFKYNQTDSTYWLQLCDSNDANNLIDKIQVKDYPQVQNRYSKIFALNQQFLLGDWYYLVRFNVVDQKINFVKVHDDSNLSIYTACGGYYINRRYDNGYLIQALNPDLSRYKIIQKSKSSYYKKVKCYKSDTLIIYGKDVFSQRNSVYKVKSDLILLGHIPAQYEKDNDQFQIDYDKIIFWNNYVVFQNPTNSKFSWINVEDRYPLKTINQLKKNNQRRNYLCHSSVILSNATTWTKVLFLNSTKNTDEVQQFDVYDNTKNGELDPTQTIPLTNFFVYAYYPFFKISSSKDKLIIFGSKRLYDNGSNQYAPYLQIRMLNNLRQTMYNGIFKTGQKIVDADLSGISLVVVLANQNNTKQQIIVNLNITETPFPKTDTFSKITIMAASKKSDFIAYSGDYTNSTTVSKILVVRISDVKSMILFECPIQIKLLCLSYNGQFAAAYFANEELWIFDVEKKVFVKKFISLKGVESIELTVSTTIVMKSVAKPIQIFDFLAQLTQQRLPFRLSPKNNIKSSKDYFLSNQIGLNNQQVLQGQSDIYSIDFTGKYIAQVDPSNGQLSITNIQNQSSNKYIQIYSHVLSVTFTPKGDLNLLGINNDLLTFTDEPCGLNQTEIQGYCSCKDSFVKNGSQCQCPKKLDFINQICACPSSFVRQGDQCASCTFFCQTCSGTASSCQSYKVWPIVALAILSLLILAGVALLIRFLVILRKKRNQLITEKNQLLTSNDSDQI